MTAVFKNDAVKITLYFFGVFLLAATLTPHVYQAGQKLIEHAAQNDVSDLIQSVADSAKRAKYNRYFSRALAFSALLLLPFLIWALKQSNSKNRRFDLRKNDQKVSDFFIGLLIAAGGFAIMGGCLYALGWFELKEEIKWAKAWKKALQPAVSASIIEEVLFRGIFLGVFLRSMSAGKAIFSLTLLFAVLHFIMPPDGIQLQKPEAFWSGFQFLGLCAQRFLQPTTFLAEFLTLFAVGYVLADTRLRTASLWMPIGLHMGWVFAFKMFNRLMDKTEAYSGNLLIGATLKEGLIPLILLCLSGIAIYQITKKRYAGHLIA